MHEKLKIIRKQFGISQMTLAKESGVSRYRISLFECEYLKLTNQEIVAINDVLSKLPRGRAL